MNNTLAHRAYHQISAPTRTARGTEYEVIARLTHRLKVSAAKGRSSFPQLVSALHENHALWTAFAMDVADPANALPQGLRAQVFYLAEFTFAHTQKVLAGKAGVSPLIEINTAIMRGLRGQGQPK